MLSGVVRILRISFERDLCRAQCAFDVEPKVLDTEVVLPFDCLFSCVELLAFVDVFTTGVTAPDDYV